MAAKVPLGEVCEITMGQAPSGDSYNTEGNGVALIAGAGDFGDLTPEPTKFTTAPTKLSRPNEVILCIRATIGDRNWSDKTYCLGRGVAGLLGKKGQLEQNYLWHWIGHATPELKAKGRGATFLQVSKADIASLEIPLPPPAEQRRIAAILDKADALRAKRREVIAMLDQLLQSVFLDMFGDPSDNPFDWPVRDLGELLKDGPQNGLYKPAQDYGSGSPILRIDGFRAGDMIKLRPAKRVRLTESEIRKYGLNAWDLVINRVNSPEHLGKPALVQEVLEPTVFESNMMRMALDTGAVCPTYMLMYLVQPFVRDQIAVRRKDAINQSSINQGDVKSLQINVPPLALQKKFEKIHNWIAVQKGRTDSSAMSLDALFESLQNRAFAGML